MPKLPPAFCRLQTSDFVSNLAYSRILSLTPNASPNNNNYNNNNSNSHHSSSRRSSSSDSQHADRSPDQSWESLRFEASSDPACSALLCLCSARPDGLSRAPLLSSAPPFSRASPRLVPSRSLELRPLPPSTRLRRKKSFPDPAGAVAFVLPVAPRPQSVWRSCNPQGNFPPGQLTVVRWWIHGSSGSNSA